jgi:hypothetical protein
VGGILGGILLLPQEIKMVEAIIAITDLYILLFIVFNKFIY